MFVTKFPAPSGFTQVLITITPQELKTPDVGRANVIRTLLDQVNQTNSTVSQLGSLIALETYLTGGMDAR